MRNPHEKKDDMFKHPNRPTNIYSPPQEKFLIPNPRQTNQPEDQNPKSSSQAASLQNRSTLLSRDPQDPSLFVLRVGTAVDDAKMVDGHECPRRPGRDVENGRHFDDKSQNGNEQILRTGRRARLIAGEELSVRGDEDRMVAAEALIELSKEARHFKR
ncbi:MAG: hypothetical protein L6R42_003170 [Xanthoria sp. 1 TBL-2021]|nr:MAG: hypothetical protein L6R42_003170 [Xanthoria sp. 1 TBL-2021]